MLKQIKSFIIFTIILVMINLTNCQDGNQKQNNGYIAAIVLSPFCGILIFLLCSCCCQYCCNPKRKIQKLFNQVESSSMKIQQFNRKKQLILLALNSMQKYPTNFAYFLKKKPFFNIVLEIIIKKQKPFFTQIKIKGKDHLGLWQGNGSILCQRGRMFFWMFKDYKDKNKVKQTGSFKYIVYQTISFNLQKGMIGKWYFVGHEKDNRYNGKWQIAFNFYRPSINVSLHQNVSLQQINGQYYGNQLKANQDPVVAQKGIQIDLNL